MTLSFPLQRCCMLSGFACFRLEVSYVSFDVRDSYTEVVLYSVYVSVTLAY